MCNTTQSLWPTNQTVSCVQTSEPLTFCMSFLEAFPVDVSQDMIWLPVQMPQGEFTEEMIAGKQNEGHWKYLRSIPSVCIYSTAIKLFCLVNRGPLTVALCSKQCVVHTGCSWTLQQPAVFCISFPGWNSVAPSGCRESHGYSEYIWSENKK